LAGTPTDGGPDEAQTGETWGMTAPGWGAPPGPGQGDEPNRLGNGLAVAALVLGIVGVVAGVTVILFFVAFPLGVLALIFGLVGQSNARKRDGAGRGQAIAGTVLGSVTIGLSIIGLLIIVVWVRDTEITVKGPFRLGRADPAVFDATVDTCTQERDFAESTGTITNTSNVRQTFVVVVAFREDATRVGEGTDQIRGLLPGETARWRTGDVVRATSVRCELAVENSI
jgi:Domain of unknown function (DUF4190)